MSLYDDDDGPPKADGSKNITMKFLQTQIAQKQKVIQTGFKNIVNPVVDLSARNTNKINMRRVQPVKPVVMSESAPLSFLPRAATDDSILLFGEVVVKNEYQPAVPNDYLLHKRKKDEREAREKAAKEIADRLAREHKEEASKREKGAAIAPPQALIEEPPVFTQPPSSFTATSASTFTPPKFLPSFGKSTSRGLGVAANIMSKFGYKHGSGLGRDEQGMNTALSVEKLGRNAGMILDESTNDGPSAVPQPSFAMPSLPSRTTNTTNVMNNSSKILMLTNVVGVDEVDSELETEMREEMGKYGQVQSITIHKMEGVPEEEAVRIFVEFTNVAQAIKAYVVMNGRFFGGRQVAGQFYSQDDYANKEYAK